MNNNRLQNFDLISGVFIIQIIIMHVFQHAKVFSDSFFSIIMQLLFFFMPWFYFKSGYFYSNSNNFNGEFVSKKIKKLLVPFIFFGALGFLVLLPFEILESHRPFWRVLLSPGYSILRFGDTGSGNTPLWFLLSLFFCNVIFSFLNKYNLSRIIIFFPIIGYLLYFYHISLPLGISNLFLGVFFFFLGSLIRRIEMTKYLKPLFALSLCIYIVSQLYFFSSLDLRTNVLNTGNYFIYTTSASSGLIIVLFVSKIVRVVRLINYIGKYSLVYFVLHWPIIIFINNLLKVFQIERTGYFNAFLTTIFIFIAMPLFVNFFNNRFPKLIGN